MRNSKTREVQLKQLELIKKVHGICQENGIKYTILGGTLLGAIRHKGFIPWDDDLDIGLPRNDYEKLMQIIKEKPIEGCFLQTYETDVHYVQPFAKLRLNRTVYDECFWEKVKMHKGIFIDIFPLDKIEEPGNTKTEIRRLISKEITFSIWKKEGCKIPRIGWKKIEIIVSSIFAVLPKKALIKLQNILVIREKKKWSYLGSMFSSNYSTKKVYFKNEDLENLILIDFEDTQLYAPSNYDDVLKRMFNNYMDIPEESKRNSGHNVCRIVIDSDDNSFY